MLKKLPKAFFKLGMGVAALDINTCKHIENNLVSMN